MSKKNKYNIIGTVAAIKQICLLLLLCLTSSASYAAEKTQVKIEQFSLNRSVAYLGEEISASVTVSVPVSLRKKTLRLRYYLDKKEIGKQILKKITPSGRVKAVFNFKDASEGRYQFRVVADLEGKAATTDEVTRQLAILSLPGGMTGQKFSTISDDKAAENNPSSGKPDLEPLSISFSIASPASVKRYVSLAEYPIVDQCRQTM